MNAIDQFTQDVSQRIDKGQLPGAQFIIREAGQDLASGCLGYQNLETSSAVTEQTLFRLASATKVFVSIAFLRLMEKSALSLTTPLSSVFPEFTAQKVFQQDGSVTAAKRSIQMIDLLRHSCGYGYGEKDYLNGEFRQSMMAANLLGEDDMGFDHWRYPNTLREWMARLSQVPMEDEPGTRVSYGLGHDIAGAVIEEVSGLRLDQFMQEQVFTPLGMAHACLVVPQHLREHLSAFYSFENDQLHLVETASDSEFMSTPMSFSGGGGWDMLGNGGIACNAADFACLLDMIMNQGRHRGEVFISEQHAAQLCRSVSHDLQHKQMLPGCEYSYGVGAVVDPKTYHTRGTGSSGPKGKMWWGGSTNTYFFYVPERRRLGVFLANTFPFGHKGILYRFGALSGL